MIVSVLPYLSLSHSDHWNILSIMCLWSGCILMAMGVIFVIHIFRAACSCSFHLLQQARKRTFITVWDIFTSVVKPWGSMYLGRLPKVGSSWRHPPLFSIICSPLHFCVWASVSVIHHLDPFRPLGVLPFVLPEWFARSSRVQFTVQFIFSVHVFSVQVQSFLSLPSAQVLPLQELKLQR